MRSSRIARHTARILSAAVVSAVLLGAAGAAPAHAGARNIKGVTTTSVTTMDAHNIKG